MHRNLVGINLIGFNFLIGIYTSFIAWVQSAALPILHRYSKLWHIHYTSHIQIAHHMRFRMPFLMNIYGDRLTSNDPLAVELRFRLLRRSLIFIGVASTIVYRSVFLRFDLLIWLESLLLSLRRRFFVVDFTTEYWLPWNRTTLSGVTICAGWGGLGVARDGNRVRNFLFGDLRDGDDDDDFVSLLLLGVLFSATGDLLLVLNLVTRVVSDASLALLLLSSSSNCFKLFPLPISLSSSA